MKPSPKWFQLICQIGLIGLITGCKTVTDHLTPDVHNHQPNAEGTYLHDAASDTAPLTKEWWKLYEDPALDELIEQLNVSNPDASAALARVNQSFAVLGITRAPTLPTIRGEGGAGTRQDSINNLLFPIENNKYDRYSLGLTTSWEIDLWGRVNSSKKRDRFAAESQANTYQGVLLSLQASLAQQYFTYQAAQTELEVLSESRHLANEYLKLQKRRFEAGDANQSEVAEAQVALQNAESALETSKRNTGKLQHAIAILVGELPSQFPEIHSTTPLIPEVPVGVPSDLLLQRPDLLAADRQLRSAATQVGIRKVDFLPKLTLLGNGGYSSLNHDNLFETNSEFFDIGPSVDIPIFQFGLRKSVVKQAKAQMKEAAANYKSTFLTAVKEVDDALLDLKSFNRELAQQRQTLAATTLSSTAAKARFDTGLTSYFDYISAQQTKLQAEARKAILSAEHLNASVRLIQALGGKW